MRLLSRLAFNNCLQGWICFFAALTKILFDGFRFFFSDADTVSMVPLMKTTVIKAKSSHFLRLFTSSQKSQAIMKRDVSEDRQTQ